MAEGEFRYLTENFGEGRVWGGYLPSDKEYNDEDRKEFHFYMTGSLTRIGQPILNIIMSLIKTISPTWIQVQTAKQI